MHAYDSRQLFIDHTSLVVPQFGVPSNLACLEMRMRKFSLMSSSMTSKIFWHVAWVVEVEVGVEVEVEVER